MRSSRRFAAAAGGVCLMAHRVGPPAADGHRGSVPLHRSGSDRLVRAGDDTVAAQAQNP
jgi:hypothetical protein